MLRLLIPIFLAVLGAGAGIGAGLMLKPEPEPEEAALECVEVAPEAAAAELPPERPEVTEFVRLNNQFIVPVLSEGRVISLVVMSLSLETLPGMREQVFAREPKLRDAFLQVMFDHANAGGFNGNFTSNATIGQLRTALRESARQALNASVIDVLVTDIARQDN